MTTKIEWCDETLNVFTGCSPISEGCRKCYAERMAKRLAGRYGYPKDNPFKPTYHSNRLEKIKKWKKPRKIFHVSMGDIFHDDFKGGIVSWEKVYSLFWHIELYGPQHTHIFLTKRLKNAFEFFDFWFCSFELPLENVWLGTTTENQKRADERLPELLKLRRFVKVLFISAEPMLESIYIKPYFSDIKYGSSLGIDWVIAGPMTGPGALPCPPGAILDLAEQCYENDIPFFDKREKYIVREFPE